MLALIHGGFRTWILNDGIRSFKDVQSFRKRTGQAAGLHQDECPTATLSDKIGVEWDEPEESGGDENRWSSLE
jgi:hypothetical protein